jgi:hypothetical protein
MLPICNLTLQMESNYRVQMTCNALHPALKAKTLHFFCTRILESAQMISVLAGSIARRCNNGAPSCLFPMWRVQPETCFTEESCFSAAHAGACTVKPPGTAGVLGRILQENK